MSLARSRRYDFPGGVTFRTPLLIPALSTRNVVWLRVEEDGEMQSLASLALQTVGHGLESLLVSAVDLARDQLEGAASFLEGGDSPLRGPEILMVDSGQYEMQKRPGLDDGTVAAGDWDDQAMLEVYARVPSDVPVIFVNYDIDGLGFQQQIAQARIQLSTFTGRTTALLLKPDVEGGFINPDRVGAELDELRWFNIIGVTEKELGNTLSERMVNLAALRRILDRADVSHPIHVFGGLDPILAPLYIMCGAEILDGVGWLRYAYVDDMATYRETRPVLSLDLDDRVHERMLRTVLMNSTYLRQMTRRLAALVGDGDFERYSRERGGELAEIWRQMAPRLKEA